MIMCYDVHADKTIHNNAEDNSQHPAKSHPHWGFHWRAGNHWRIKIPLTKLATVLMEINHSTVF